MLTEREKEIVASFRPWVKAFKRDDFRSMASLESKWWGSTISGADIVAIRRDEQREKARQVRDARNAEIERLYRDGWKIDSLVEHFGLSVSSIFDQLHLRNVPLRGKGNAGSFG